jgi:hypothetical protein
MFKWNNNFSWTFNGNLAGKSQIKQAVKDVPLKDINYKANH